MTYAVGILLEEGLVEEGLAFKNMPDPHWLK
jgi:hypothetical protein